MIRAVFFDVDDTLVDFDAASKAALRRIFGVEFDVHTWDTLAREYYPRYTSGELGFEAMRSARMAHFLRTLGRPDVDAAELEARRWADMPEHFVLFDDVRPCLDAVRAAGYLIGAITNNEPDHQWDKLRRVGLDRAFDAVVISGAAGVAKPDPAIFKIALGEVGVEAPAAVHVGDNLDADVRGAAGAGLAAVWLNRTGLEIPDPAPTWISDLSELPRRIAELDG
ncbi:MAG: HAD-IA family hydrolase [Actinobacteria bacterium]|nr:HAD-IA family hydrolase [Actinomycetota bacterium]